MPTGFFSPTSPVVTGANSPAVANATHAVTLTREFLLVPSRSKDGSSNIPIPAGQSTIGSGEDCQIRLTNTGIAALHAVLDYQNDRLTLKSVDHRTWLNDGAVKSSSVRAGDRLTFGPVEFLLHERLKEVAASKPIEPAPIFKPAVTVVEAFPLPVTEELKTPEAVRETVQKDLHKTVQQLAALTPHVKSITSPVPVDTPVDLSGPLKNEIARLVDELDEQKRDVLAVRAQLQQSEAAVDELRNIRSTLEAQLTELAGQKAQSDAALAGLREELRETSARLSQQSDDATQMVQRLQDELANKERHLAETEKSLQEQRTQWEQTTTGLECELAVLTNQLTQAETELTLRRDETLTALTAKESELHELQSRLQSLQAELVGVHQARDESERLLGSENARLKEELSRLDETLALTSTTLAQTEETLNEKLAALSAEADKQRQQIVALTSDKTSLMTALESKNSDLELREQAVEKRQIELDAGRAALMADREVVDATREELAQLEAELQSKQAAWETEKSALEAALKLREEELAAETQRLHEQSTNEKARAEELDRTASELNDQRVDLEQQRARLLEEKTQVSAERNAVGDDLATLQREQDALTTDKQLFEEQKTRFEESALARDEKLAETSRQLDSLRDSLTAEKAELIALRERLEVEQQSLAGLQAELDVEKAANETQAVSLTSEQDRLAALELQLAQERTALDAARTEIDEQSKALSAQRDEIEQLTHEIESRQSQIDLSHAELDAARSQHETQAVSLVSDRDRLASLESQLAQERAALEAARNEIETQAESLASQRSELEELVRQLESRQTSMDEVQTALAEERAAFLSQQDEFAQQKTQTDDEAQQTIAALEAQLADAQSLIDSHKAEFAAYQDLSVNEQQAFHSQLEQLAAQLAELNTVRSDLEAELATVRNELSLKQNDESSRLDEEAIQRELDLIGRQQSDLDYQAEILDRRSAELNLRQEQLADEERRWLFEQRTQAEQLDERVVEVSTAEQDLAYQQEQLDELRRELETRTAELNEQRELLEEAFQRVHQSNVRTTESSCSSGNESEKDSSRELGENIWQNLQSTFQEDAPVYERTVVEENVDMREIMATPLSDNVIEPAAATEQSVANDNHVRSLLAEMFGMSSGSPSSQRAVVDSHNNVEQRQKPESTTQEAIEDNPFADMADSFVEPADSTLEETPVEQQAEENVEDSIASYMEKLLSRSRGHQTPEKSHDKKGTTSATKPRSGTEPARSYLSHQGKAREPIMTPVPAEVEETPVIRERPQVNKDAARQDIHKLRALANQSARVAVATHTWKQVRLGIVVNATLSSVCLVLALFLGSTYFWAEQSFLTYGALSGVIGLVSAGQVYRLMELTKRAKKSTEEQEAEAVVEE